MKERSFFDLQRITDALAHSIDSIQIVRSDGRLLWLNAQSQAALGLTAGIIGTEFASHWPEEAARRIREALAADPPAAVHFTAARGRSTWWDVAMVPVGSEDDPGRGFVVTCHDVTERETRSKARDILLEEMRHRQGNTLALASMLISLHGRDRPELGAFAEEMSKRLAAMGRAQAVVARQEAAEQDVLELDGLLQMLVRPLVGPDCELVVDVEPGIVLPAERIDVVGMVLSELAVNSAKHGAFALGGRLALSVMRTDEGIEFHWQERSDGEVTARSRPGGMGQSIMNRFAAAHDGDFQVSWRPRGQLARLILNDRRSDVSAA